MASTDKKGVPPVTPKSKGVEQLPPNTKAQTLAGDLYGRERSQYGKDYQSPQDDPFWGY